MPVLDIHHIPNIKDAKRLIKGFNVATGISIALSVNTHRNIRSTTFDDTRTARELMAKEILHLRKYSAIPAAILLKLIELNRQKYPTDFKRII